MQSEYFTDKNPRPLGKLLTDMAEYAGVLFDCKPPLKKEDHYEFSLSEHLLKLLKFQYEVSQIPFTDDLIHLDERRAAHDLVNLLIEMTTTIREMYWLTGKV